MNIDFVSKWVAKPWFRHVLFVFILLATSYYYNYHEIISYRPTSMHQWRNSVSASIALNYYHEGEFFHPRTHNTQVDDYSNDITITEFPVIYYFIGILYKIFGFHEEIYKGVNVLIGFAGLYFLFLLGWRVFRKILYALFLPLVIFSSPIFVYYTNNFIPDATSLSIVFIGLYFYYRYYEDQRMKDFVWSMVFFGLAGLIKTPAFLLFFGTIGIFGLDRIFGLRLKEGAYMFNAWLKAVIGFSVVLVAAFAWYAYAKIYTDIHGGVVSPVAIRPIWILNSETISVTWEAISQRFRNGNYHSPVLLIITALLFIHNMIFWKRHNRMMNWFILLAMVGGIAFSLLFYRSLRQHDYYQMNNLIIPVLVWFNFFLYLRDRYNKVFNSWILQGGLAMLLGFFIYKCNMFMANRYYGGWFMDYAIEHYNHRYDEITPYLRSLGIDRYDKVYCTYDPSINISLYLMDQKGFTDFYRRDRTFTQKVEFFSAKGLKYVIIGDYDTLDVEPESLGLEKIGEYNEVGIYRVPSTMGAEPEM